MDATDILAAAVRLTVGTGALPRPGQMQLCTDVAATLATRGQLVGIGPTGVGKSFALLSAAAWRAVEYGERTVFSTESLGLQAQILRKDAPTISDAVVSLGGRPVVAAVLKGATNYVDPRQLVLAAEAITGQITETNYERLACLVEDGPVDTVSAIAFADGANLPRLCVLVAWGLRQYADEDLHGDKDSFPGDFSDAEWRLVSAGPSERTPDEFEPTPKVTLARGRAAGADVIVVNHSLLALRAATGLPIVLGSRMLGEFDHLIVDEAQNLPDRVRERGAVELSGSDVVSLTERVLALRKPAFADEQLDTRQSQLAVWAAAGVTLAEELEAALAAQLAAKLTGEPAADALLEGLADRLVGWAGSVVPLTESSLAPAAATASRRTQVVDTKAIVRAARARAAATNLAERVRALSTPVPGEARWVAQTKPVEDVRRWTVLKTSPVDVAPWITDRLWAVQGERLSAVTVSATLPAGFAREVGLVDDVHHYESPFASAYQGSAVFVPTARLEADLDAISETVGGRRKFDTKRHPLWAAQHAIALVQANAGSAIVLAATVDAGKLYAAALRTALPDLTVYSQWDGVAPARLVERWRADLGSVLVGTKLFMTGVDAPGETCSLVILDRPPRRPMEPVYDARVAQLQETMDRWEADRLVYVADAAMLEEQAIGRLIRSTADSGLVAILDPRLRVGGPLSYHPETQAAFYAPLKAFGTHLADRGEAVAWLEQRRAA